ncbi:7-carboxy-7-deazaguanine synthase [Lewinellaceae bacterium SD302]|nr:7-carboxy-7-deazaguanine synthase [Lewinellaceae bacterium SD302]
MIERTYKVKEVFYTLQGEGGQAGRAAVFLRFTGCNLWSGREEDRPKAICKFCDTDFVGTDGENGGRYSASSLADKVAMLWPSPRSGKPYVVCTGGEPLLQLDESLIKALHEKGFEIAVETNGTIPAPASIDWICVSPKAGSEVVQRSGHELKLVYPQKEVEAQPELFADLDFEHFYLQPLDGPNTAQNTVACVEYCLANPQWKVSLQTHKILDIP